ncbi:hypothetical protein C8J57DRAFT_1264099 [Mycena rebaudengoi]|nr:hypothetical protein C8J57DRAFT_1264099 [Mycena rebaudengoi]
MPPLPPGSAHWPGPCRGGTVVEHREQLLDKPCTGKNWWDADDLLPGPKGGLYPSCYLRIHTWLDKGQLSTKVKMHPILIRGFWINSAIREMAGVTLGPPELRNIDAKSLASAEREDFAKLRALIYNRINAVILDSLKHRSRYTIKSKAFIALYSYRINILAINSDQLFFPQVKTSAHEFTRNPRSLQIPK